MENPYWEESIGNGPTEYTFVLAKNVRLSVQQVRDSLSAMQGINSPNPLYEVLVKAATDYMARARQNQTATEARAKAENDYRQQHRSYTEDILRSAAEAMQSDIFKRPFGGAYAGFDFSSKPDFTAFHTQQRTAPPPPRSNQPRHWKEVLGFNVNQHVQKHEAKSAYRRKALQVQQKHDGDEGAMHDDMVALNVAKREFERELGK